MWLHSCGLGSDSINLVLDHDPGVHSAYQKWIFLGQNFQKLEPTPDRHTHTETDRHTDATKHITVPHLGLVTD